MEFLQQEWGLTLVLDLFLGGMGAAAFAVVAVMELARKEACSKVKLCCSWIAALSLAVGVVCLLLDVGQPLRAMLLPLSFNNFASSWMAWGAWFMLLSLVSSGLYALVSTDCLMKRVFASSFEGEVFGRRVGTLKKVLAAVGGVFSVAVTIYTGCLISSGGGVPFWTTPLLPATFFTASFFAGTAVVNAACVYFDEAAGAFRRRLLIVSLVAGLLFGLFLALYIGVYAAQSEKALTAFSTLVSGSWSIVLWLGVVAVGIVLPVVLTVFELVLLKKESASASTLRTVAFVTLAAIVIGGFAWRMIVIALGMHAPLLSVDPLQMHEGVTFLLER